MRYLVIYLLSALVLLACKTTAPSTPRLDTNTTIEAETDGAQESGAEDDYDDNIIEPPTEDCYTPRKVIRELQREEGQIMLIGDQYVISMKSGNRRYQPCTMPKAFRKAELAVTFSGDQLEINPGERRIATPIRLRYLALR